MIFRTGYEHDPHIVCLALEDMHEQVKWCGRWLCRVHHMTITKVYGQRIWHEMVAKDELPLLKKHNTSINFLNHSKSQITFLLPPW